MKTDGLHSITLTTFDKRRVLIGTRSKGFFIYDPVDKTLTPFPTEVDDYIKTRKLYHGIGLLSSPGRFALATLGGGMVVMDSQGKLKNIFDKQYGLATDSIYHVFEDNSGNIWLGHAKGISKIEYNSPISIFDENRSNLPGIVLPFALPGSNCCPQRGAANTRPKRATSPPAKLFNRVRQHAA